MFAQTLFYMLACLRNRLEKTGLLQCLILQVHLQNFSHLNIRMQNTQKSFIFKQQLNLHHLTSTYFSFYLLWATIKSCATVKQWECKGMFPNSVYTALLMGIFIPSLLPDVLFFGISENFFFEKQQHNICLLSYAGHVSAFCSNNSPFKNVE